MREYKRKELIRSIRNRLYQNVPFISRPKYYTRRVDNEKRWEFIKSKISDSDEFLLDLGCAEGFFTHKSSQLDLLSLGIDGDREALKYARSHWGHLDGLGFMGLDIGPTNVPKLPSSDITLLLTVHQWWIKQHGSETANKMLINIAENTQKLFYEMPANKWYDPYHIEYNVKDLDTGKTQNIKARNYYHPQIGNKLEPGKYLITATADKYVSSKEHEIIVNAGSSKLDDIGVIVSDNEISIVDASNQPSEAEIFRDHYNNLLVEILEDELSVEDSIVTPYEGGSRSDILFYLE